MNDLLIHEICGVVQDEINFTLSFIAGSALSREDFEDIDIFLFFHESRNKETIAEEISCFKNRIYQKNIHKYHITCFLENDESDFFTFFLINTKKEVIYGKRFASYYTSIYYGSTQKT
jgi:hypothetical protein